MVADGETDLRLVPDLPLPAYAYIPGRTARLAAGHLPDLPFPHNSVRPEAWQDCVPFLYGIDLFNAGYWWEAHEVWEDLWQACGRNGVRADFLKGLIALAAAGVKAAQGKPDGTDRHAVRAGHLFRQTQAAVHAPRGRYFGLSVDDLIGMADELVARARATAPDDGDRFMERIVLSPA